MRETGFTILYPAYCFDSSPMLPNEPGQAANGQRAQVSRPTQTTGYGSGETVLRIILASHEAYSLTPRLKEWSVYAGEGAELGLLDHHHSLGLHEVLCRKAVEVNATR